MSRTAADTPIRRRLVARLYTEALETAEEARRYFDASGRDEREALDPSLRVAFSCESLKVTTRLMHVIAWLLTQQAIAVGEITFREALDPSRRLGESPQTETMVYRRMPDRARTLIAASIDLHRRVAHLDATLDAAPHSHSPVRSMQERLASFF